MPCPLLLKVHQKTPRPPVFPFPSPENPLVVPLQTRPARELAMRVLEYGRCDWNEPDDRGVPLYKVIIQSGRAELAAKAAAGLRKKDAENPELAPAWAEPLYKVY